MGQTNVHPQAQSALRRLTFGALVALISWGGSAAAQTEVITEIQTRGNVATSDEEMRRLAGVDLGTPVEPDTFTKVADRLRAAKRFERVEVLKRFASIEDPSKIVLVIIVDEGAVSIKRTGDPNNPTRVVRRRWPNFLYSPILGGESGYGATYGVLITRPEPLGKDSRIAFPLSWGGQKRAGADFEKRYPDRLITRIEAGGSVSRRRNPLFEADDDRETVYFRAERQFNRALRVRALSSWQDVFFRDTSDRFVSIGAEGIFDTRLDPFLARDAVYVRASANRLTFDRRDSVTRIDVEGHAYVGLFGQAIFVASARRDSADGPMPDYLKALIGGPSTVRGFKSGTASGDTLLGGSLEVRVPLTSPLKLGKIGVTGFYDAGTVYDAGGSIDDRPFLRGFGSSVFFTAAFVRINVAVAHGIGASTRVQLLGNLTF